MYIVGNYFTAVVFCMITMLCWGSWGNTQKLASRSWRYELFLLGLCDRYGAFLHCCWELTMGSAGVRAVRSLRIWDRLPAYPSDGSFWGV